MRTAAYDPFSAGRFEVATVSIDAEDEVRRRHFPVEVWSPRAVASGLRPLVLFSHYSGGNRRSSSFLCEHLASHGFVVVALDHSEVVALELRRSDGETPGHRAARVRAIIASRVPDLRFLLDHMLARADLALDPSRVGGVGHSFGGWTVLALPEADPRVGSVVALAPGGSDRPRPGIIPCRLTFEWRREVPVLFVAGDGDVPVPLGNVVELYWRAPSPKRMYVLRNADHQHFVDDVEGDHEALRTATFEGDGAWIPGAMRPIGELMSGDQAHRLVRGLTLAHFDASLRGDGDASRFLDGVAATDGLLVYPG